MIDFRYHLVSIVAVFLALATGIVIGATSLQGQVAGTLRGQVGQLREDKQGLRGQLDNANESGRRQDAFAADVSPKALAGQLAGRSVAVVALPGTSSSLLRTTQVSLRNAGATITVTAEVDDSWAGGSATERSATLRSAAAGQGQDPGKIPANRLGGLVLAEALTTKPGDSASSASTPGLSTLVRRGLLQATPDSPRRAQSIVVLWPGLQAPRSGQGPLPAWADLVTALGLSGRPAVGVSAGPVDPAIPTPDALVSSLRNSAEVTGTMSTIDDGDRPVGQAAAVLALRDEYTGRSGHFGLDKDASAVAPNLERPE